MIDESTPMVASSEPAIRSMVKDGAGDAAADQVVSIAAQHSADAAIKQTDVEAFAATQQVVPQHWWQSQLVDYFIYGALFVLVVIVIVEAINFLREKRR